MSGAQDQAKKEEYSDRAALAIHRRVTQVSSPESGMLESLSGRILKQTSALDIWRRSYASEPISRRKFAVPQFRLCFWEALINYSKGRTFPRGLKPYDRCCIYVRAEARTLQNKGHNQRFLNWDGGCWGLSGGGSGRRWAGGPGSRIPWCASVRWRLRPFSSKGGRFRLRRGRGSRGGRCRGL